MAQPEMPSQVTDRDFLYMPPEDEVSGDEEWANCGKWALPMSEFGMDMLDRTWLSLQKLLSDGPLIMLKASTALKEVEHAHIQCFTKPGKMRAKRAADAIRKVLQEEGVEFTGIMYYKQNELTIQGRACREGSKNHTVYMHTFLGKFYGRDRLNNWELDDEDETTNKVRISHKYYRKTSSGSYDLPATSRKSYKVLQHEGSDNAKANWYVYCSYEEDDDGYLAPADRVWMVARELYDQAVFREISWSKRAGKVEIRFYVSEETDVRNQIITCDRIFREASLQGIMYYRISSDDKYRYKYTSEKELYERRQFGEIYLPNKQE